MSARVHLMKMVNGCKDISIMSPFAKLLSNFCETKRKFLFSLRFKIALCAIVCKHHFAKLRYSVLTLFCFANFVEQFLLNS